MRKLRKTLRILLEIALVIVIIICGFMLYPYIRDWYNSRKQKEVINEVIKENVDEDSEYFSKEAWDALKAQNPDLFAYLVFPDYVSLPIMKNDADSNYYLRRAFDTTYNEEGTPFVDNTTDENQQNIVVYGHNVYYDDTAMFSPLSFLVDQSVFDEHHTFYVYFENEVRTYEVTNVYEWATNSDYNFQQAYFYEESPLMEYIKYPNEHNLITSNYSVSNENDQLMTFQTCKRWDSSTRIVTTGILVATETYPVG